MWDESEDREAAYGVMVLQEDHASRPPRRRSPRSTCVRRATTKTQATKSRQDMVEPRRTWRPPWTVVKTSHCECCLPSSPETCQLQLLLSLDACDIMPIAAACNWQVAGSLLNTSSRCMQKCDTCKNECKKAVVWYNTSCFILFLALTIMLA